MQYQCLWHPGSMMARDDPCPWVPTSLCEWWIVPEGRPMWPLYYVWRDSVRLPRLDHKGHCSPHAVKRDTPRKNHLVSWVTTWEVDPLAPSKPSVGYHSGQRSSPSPTSRWWKTSGMTPIQSPHKAALKFSIHRNHERESLYYCLRPLSLGAICYSPIIQ